MTPLGVVGLLRVRYTQVDVYLLLTNGGPSGSVSEIKFL